ncbi:hypothetical protein FACS18949_03120 [Clostridia bacterium]|nr:hypothetical protein FACS18949_03120 [Clostridia bacterium]
MFGVEPRFELVNDRIKPLHEWQAETVRKILRKVQYTGVHVSGKWFTSKDGKKCIKPESDWKITPGAIPEIISEETYEKVAEVMANRDRRVGAPVNHLLRSVVKCGCCGRTMKYARQLEPMYRCYHTIADPNAECHKSEISAAKLEKIVLTVIRKRAELVLKTADLFKLRRKSVDERKVSDVENEIAQNAAERQQQYERFVLGDITRDEYAELKADCSARLERLTKQLAAMKSEIDANKIDPQTVAVAKSALSESDNNRELVEALIKAVKVYPNNRVDIDWNIAGFGSAE